MPTLSSNKSPSFSLDELDGLLEKHIREAVQKTNEIIGRQQWVKSEVMSRATRIGHFTTTLRREIGPLVQGIPDDFGRRLNTQYSSPGNLKSFLMKLYDTDMWDDVGFPKLYGKWGKTEWSYSCSDGTKGWNMTNEKMDALCRSATATNSIHETVEDINKSLVNLERDMYPLRTGIETLNRLNAESDKIAQNLCAIVEGSK